MMAGTWPRLPALGQPRTRYATSIASFSANFCSVLRPAGPSAFWYGSSRTSLRAVPPPQPIGARLWFGVTSLLKFIPVVFLLEEVWFRGVFDSHLHHPGEKRGVLSAIYVSALWGIWHPVIPGHQIQTLLPTFATVIPFHVLIGVPFSLFWRRSGNLFVPASVHCLIDAVRNGLAGPPV